ncbi:Bifunctional lysine-specific demethylase and histidyl-hydroxylase NO66 [Hondaea fermentalgiana]|uniref:Bifunctional lysine-specific demethylase and histidyl-hydroxylase NO66 n=1 Tax=Hondaea fermentalgiana TaxID=2315210 RepID=A0A2R5GFD5_9STRA|nr:Bifunctional lysine-specific demethylase and histidyl-hydroxylase NO66 [Hondaea fermentalgiana]|eukprot:GBG27343.1 Bifunctional lysine-specific demethylase and histidyl-hydroxylase NO66 [Hondaea fermentalgiana]
MRVQYLLALSLSALLLALVWNWVQQQKQTDSSAEPKDDGNTTALFGPGCKMPRETNLSCEDFVKRYLGQEPVVLRGVLRSENEAFFAATASAFLREHHGSLPVKISTANSFTGRDWTETDLATYMDSLLRPQDESRAGNQTLYLFGSQQGPAWEDFLRSYHRPTLVYPSESFVEASLGSPSPEALCLGLDADQSKGPGHLSERQDRLTSLSFGLAGAGTGVPFHFHGPGFLQMIHGRKRWFLYPPGSSPDFHPNATTLSWVRTVYPHLTESAKPSHECVLEPGDVIYFPNSWMHATLNLDNYTAFVATFA